MFKISERLDARYRAHDDGNTKKQDVLMEEGSEGDQSIIFSSAFVDLFYRVIYDEGYKLKNPKTRNFTAVETLYAPYLWITTATPMINRVDDLLGYLCLFWKPEWLDDLDDLDGWVGPNKLESRYKESVLASLAEEAPKYHALYGGHPLFVFDPRAFATLLNTGKMAQPAVSHLVLRAILSRI